MASAVFHSGSRTGYSLCSYSRAQPVRRPVLVLMGAAILVLLGYTIVMVTNVGNAGRKMSGIIPFSHHVERLWQERYGTPLRLVGESICLSGLFFMGGQGPKSSRLGVTALNRIFIMRISDLPISNNQVHY